MLCSDGLLCWWSCSLAVPRHATFRHFEFLDLFSSSSICVSLCFCNPLLSGLHQGSCIAVLNTCTLPWPCFWEPSSIPFSVRNGGALTLVVPPPSPPPPASVIHRSTAKPWKHKVRGSLWCLQHQNRTGPCPGWCMQLRGAVLGRGVMLYLPGMQVRATPWVLLYDRSPSAAGCPYPSSAQVTGTIQRQLHWKGTVTLWNRAWALRKLTKLTEHQQCVLKQGCGVTHKPISYIISATNLQRRSGKSLKHL